MNFGDSPSYYHIAFKCDSKGWWRNKWEKRDKDDWGWMWNVPFIEGGRDKNNWIFKRNSIYFSEIIKVWNWSSIWKNFILYTETFCVKMSLEYTKQI